MRQYVIQAARRRRALKRGGMEILVTLDESMDLPVSSDQELLAEKIESLVLSKDLKALRVSDGSASA